MKQNKAANRAKNNSRAPWIIGAAALGAIAMYLGDPERGRRRRAMARDKMASAVSKTSKAVDAARRDFTNRAEGMRTQASRLVASSKTAANELVRTPKLGQLKNQLMTRSSRTDSWKPGARAAALVGGGTLGALSLASHTRARALLAMASLGLMARALANMPLTRMMGVKGDREAVHLHKSIFIQASPEEVFDVWCQYENFPRFMANVQEIRDLGGGRSHWVVRGPLGSTVEWDAMTTESRRAEVLAWQSEPGSTVQTSGRIRFVPEGSGTRAHIHLAYTPPAGAIGHAVAALFGKDAKHEMDEDLLRMKQYIESGNRPRDAIRTAQPPSTLH